MNGTEEQAVRRNAGSLRIKVGVTDKGKKNKNDALCSLLEHLIRL